MTAANSVSSRHQTTWWQRLFAWIRRLLGRGPALLRPAPAGSRWGDYAPSLPDDLRSQLDRLSDEGVVWDTVRSAIEDYGDLREVMQGPGATADTVNDVELLAEAEDVLRSIIGRAPNVQVLVDVAGKRSADRAGREAAGDAILELRDDGKALHDTASAAIRWAASRSDRDGRHLEECAGRLSAIS